MNILTVDIKNPHSLTLNEVVEKPRLISPGQIDEAIQNHNLVFMDCKDQIQEIIKWVIGDFFKFSHQSGLYNRQMDLWKAISFVKYAQVKQLTSGLVKKIDLPFYDIYLNDANDKTLILIAYVSELDSIESGSNFYKQIVSNFLNRIQNLKNKSTALKGSFVVLPDTVSTELLNIFIGLIKSADPLLDYEAKLPYPVNISLNILTIDEKCENIKLNYPILKKRELIF